MTNIENNIIIIYILLFITILLALYTFFYFNTSVVKNSSQFSIPLKSTDPIPKSTIVEMPSHNIFSINSGNLRMISFPTGMIMIWYPIDKSITSLSLLSSSIPIGWAVCDGTNGTPDLRGRFVLMPQDDIVPTSSQKWSSIHPIGSTGGNESHILTIAEMPSHNHAGGNTTALSVNSSANNGAQLLFGMGSPGTWCSAYGQTNPTGGSLPHNILPPYYTLVYIMRL